MAFPAYLDPFARDHLPPADAWPRLVFELPELDYPQRLNCAAELLDRRVAAGEGERIALRTREGACTYRQLLARANRIARVLAEDLRLPSGSRVLLHGYNDPMLAACWLGVLKAGCIVVTTMPLLRAAELRAVVEKAAVTAALCDDRLRGELEPACRASGRPVRIVDFNADGSDALETLLDGKPDDFVSVDTAADDVALMAFTSGTTGEPKCTVHFHRDILAMSDCFPRSILRTTAADVFCGTPPLAFTYGLGGLLCFPLRHGASSVLIERPDPEAMLRAIEDFRVTICFTVPSFWRQMAGLAKGRDLSSLKHCVSAGEPLPDATRRLWREATGLEIIDGLGATEMLHIFVSHKPGEARAGAIGQAIPGYRVRIVDERGRELPPGTMGRLAVQGPTGCRYLADARQRDYVEDGWNITGDICSMDADGYVRYHARADDLIVSSGYKIAGPEVENVLLEHPAVLECAVVGVPDEQRGRIVKAHVVLREGFLATAALAAELQAFVKDTLAPYKYPRAIEFVSALPRSGTSKLQRYRLRENDA